ncbi:MAG: PIN domain-containing protein [Promethearchaeota archaeon]
MAFCSCHNSRFSITRVAFRTRCHPSRGKQFWTSFERKTKAPVIVLHELYKVISEKNGKTLAGRITAQIQQECKILPVNLKIALKSAAARLNKKIPMADALIATTAILHDSFTCTDDPHFDKIAGSKNIWIQ